MAHTSKRAKTTTMSMGTTDEPNSGDVSAPRQHFKFIPFQTGPTLDRIPDDVLHETLSHLPTLDDCSYGFEAVRAPALRALSKTSRLLRSRCLAMAWRRVEMCGTVIPKDRVMFFNKVIGPHSKQRFKKRKNKRVIGDTIKTNMRALETCSHLLPLIQTVSVILTHYQSTEIVPVFAACLATLPNLNTIQVTHAHPRMMTAIKDGFEGTQLPSVRRISLPSSAHEIIKSCPNIEEVICTQGNGSTIIGSLARGSCRQVRVIKGISAPLTRLVKLVPNLTHMSVEKGGDMKQLTGFPLLDTIEIVVSSWAKQGKPLSEIAAPDVEAARKILKENKSQGGKTVMVTKWNATWDTARFEFEANETMGYMIREAIRV